MTNVFEYLMSGLAYPLLFRSLATPRVFFAGLCCKKLGLSSVAEGVHAASTPGEVAG